MGKRFSERRPILPVAALLLVVGILAPVGAQRTDRNTLTPRRSVAGGVPGGVVAWGNNDYGQTNLPSGLDGGLRALSAGSLHNLAVKTDGAVIAWGVDTNRQVAVPAGLSGVVDVSAGLYHSVALKSDGTVVAWGSNTKGQTNVPVGLSGVTAISAGMDFTLALKNDGTVVVWGDDERGVISQLPNNLAGVKVIAAGSYHALALKADGTVTAWGDNQFSESNVPGGLTSVVALAAGHSHSVALKSDGTVVAWGGNGSGQANVPAGLTGVVEVVAGTFYTAALKSDGTVVAWGGNQHGETTLPAGLSSVAVLEGGEAHTLALRTASSVRAWGYNADGQASVPAGLGSVKAVAAGASHNLVLKSDGTVTAWGRNNAGQATVPAGLSGVVEVGAGSVHSVALKSDGTLVAWGDNTYGQLDAPPLTGVIFLSTSSEFNVVLKGDGAVAAWGFDPNSLLGVPGGLSGVKSVATSAQHVLALKSDGSVVDWGSGFTVPGGLTGVKAVAAGLSHSLALKSDGTVVAWGLNDRGQTDVPNGLTGVIAIAAGIGHSLALKGDGTVVAWGWNLSNQTNVPAGLTGVTALAAGNNHTVTLGAILPPTLGNPGAQETLEDQSTSAIPFTVGDATAAAESLAVTAEASVPTLLSSLLLGGSGANRTVKLIPAANAHGATTITLNVSNGSASTSVSFPFTVTSVNDAPAFTKGADQTVNQNSGPHSVTGWATGIQPGPAADEFVQNLQFQVTGNTNTTLFSAGPAVNATTGDLTYTPAAGASGNATITLRLRDDGGTANNGVDTSATQTFTITVTASNTPPVATGETYDTGYAARLEVAAPGVLANDTDADQDPLTATLVTPPTFGPLVLNADGSFVYTPWPGFIGEDTFTYRAGDGTEQSALATVKLHVAQLPASTPKAKVTGSGSVLVNGVKVKFTVSAAFKKKVTGKLTFKDPNPARAVKKAVITAVVVNGRHAQVYGVATLADNSLKPFMADLDDPVRGGGPDRFGLRLANGETVPSSVVTGKVTIKP